MALSQESWKKLAMLVENHMALEILPFHNFDHVQKVIKQVEFLAKNEHISGEKLEDLLIATYCHETGMFVEKRDTVTMLNADRSDHEKRSMDFAEKLLLDKLGFTDKERIERIRKLIWVTRSNVKPENHLEQIMKDADNYGFGSLEFEANNELLWREEKFWRELSRRER